MNVKFTISDLCKKRWTKTEDDRVLQPFAYIVEGPGNHLRLKLAKAFNYWLNIPQDKQEIIEDVIHTMNKSSLLFDDIEDNSKIRRGKPPAHVVYGIPMTVNASSYTIFIAMRKISELHHPDAAKIFIHQLKELHKGQGIDLYWRENMTCPTEEDYLKMTVKKTGAFFVLALRLMQLFSDNKSDFTKLVYLLGAYCQIIDDYTDLHNKECMDSKGFCEDIQEGKFNFPIVHAISQNPSDKRIIYILKQKTANDDLKNYCVSLLEHYGSFDYCRKRLLEMQSEISGEIRKLGGNPYMDEIVSYSLKKIS